MVRTDYINRFLLTGVFLLCLLQNSQAQDTFPAPQRVKDTGQVIHLINADILLGIQGTKEDSSQIQKLIGNVRLKQGGTIFTCDSALQYLSNNTIDAYGHIHINQADTINTYADFLHYEGNTRMATLKRNVRMSDGHMVLTTNFLTYDMQNHIGSYLNGGELDNQSTVLTSERGYYYADTKEVYFKTDVKLNDPQYTLTTDTLRYNTRTHIATFVAPTAINTGKTIIYTSCGYYSTDEQYSHLCNRPSIVDSTGTLTADTLNFSKPDGIGTAYNNVVWTDTSGQVTVKSNYAISNRLKQTILATRQPLLILSQKSDTLFVASDTLFSGPVYKDTTMLEPDTTSSDTLSYVYIQPGNPVVRQFKDSLQRGPDSTGVLSADTTYSGDSTGREISASLPVLYRSADRDTVMIPAVIPLFPPVRTAEKVTIDTTSSPITDTLASPPDTLAGTRSGSTLPEKNLPDKKDSSQLRNVIAFHHVRLFSDSLQGIADSLYYSDVDSAFHFYGDPVLWTGNTQLTGDTIVLVTKDQKASRLLLQENAMIINKVGPDQYNQIKGNQITGYFNDSSQLDWMEVEGNAESIYYAQEDSGAFVGVNQTTSASIRLYFKDNHLDKVVFIKQASGTFKNPVGLTEEDKVLKGFRWEAEKRPHSKADLFPSKKYNYDANNRREPVRKEQPEREVPQP